MGGRVQLRLRKDADLGACEQLAREVHRRDGYPRRLPGDLRGFIASAGAICGWVADVESAVVGHVALNATGSREVMDLAADVTGAARGRFGFVTRLLVSPSVRRQGIGRSLLETAMEHAVVLGLTPMLEVTTELSAAIDFYEGCGWLPIGTTAVHWRSGDVVDEHVYIAPVRPDRIAQRPELAPKA